MLGVPGGYGEGLGVSLGFEVSLGFRAIGGEGSLIPIYYNPGARPKRALLTRNI